MQTLLTELEIEGFRAIRKPLRLSLVDPSGRPLTRVVLAGTNGSGKTSVLEAILLALGRETLIVRDLPAAVRGDHWRVEVPPGARISLQYRVEALSAPPKEYNVLRTAERWEVRDERGDLVADQESAVRAHLGEIPVEYFSSWRAPILPGGLQPTTLGRPLADNEANRLRRLKQRIINERARGAISRKSAGEPPLARGRDAEWLERLNLVWSGFHSDGSSIDLDVVEPSAEDVLFDLFIFDGPVKRCSIDQISSGELELLTIAGYLLLDAFSGILLIDEPELHLHREWQTALLDALRVMAPGAQLVIATHADPPWDQAFTFERFFLAPAGDPRAAAGTA